MRVSRLLGSATLVVAASTVLAAGPPAGAAISTSVSGTFLTVTVTGDEQVMFACQAGSVVIGFAAVTPSMPCATLSKVTVNGDGGQQTVRGDSLDGDLFAASPRLVTDLGAGDDRVWDTDRADTISTGPGDDLALLTFDGVANAFVDVGADTDVVLVEDTDGDDTLTVAASGASLEISRSGGTTTAKAANAEEVIVDAGAGDDLIDFRGVEVGSTISRASASGGEGDDVLRAGPTGAILNGGRGTNALLGDVGDDALLSFSSTDTVRPGAGRNEIDDLQSLRSGGRTYIPGGGDDTYVLSLFGGDAVARVRRGSGVGTARFTASLARPGQASLPDTTSEVLIALNDQAGPDDRGLVDAVALDGTDEVWVYGDIFDDDLVDLTVPEGGWSVEGTPGDTSAVVTDSPLYGDLVLSNIVNLSVHGPWASKDRGWVHRVHRDLLFRFASAATLDEGQAFLGAGTVTRSQVTADLMGTDEYRGLDVDRSFRDFLRRTPDAAGRAYWVSALRDGRSLRTFRAQLFGSNEYFSKVGGSNAVYVVSAYQDVLGRAPDASGAAYWTSRLDAGASRGFVALQFLSTPEARRTIVEEQFLRFLDRLPTSGEATTWVSTLGSSATGEQQLIAYLVNSTSYYDRT